MANLDENSGIYNWEEDGVYQLEETDPLQGGPGGIANRQASVLAARTRNLHNRVSSVETNKAGLESPAFTGTPTVPDPAEGSPATQAANIGYVANAINEAISEIPEVKMPTELPPTDGSVTYATVGSSLKGIATDNEGAWDFSAAGIIVATIAANTTPTFTNYQTNKTVKVKITGNYSLDLSAFLKAKGSQNYDGSRVNYIYFDCWDSASGATDTIYNIVHVE